MNIKELWVGESVRMVASGRIGIYEGPSKDGRARVSINEKVYLVKPANLEIYTEPKVDRVKEIMVEMNQKSNACKIGSTHDSIDLHIKTLNSSLANGKPEHILTHQLASCKTFIEQALGARVWSVTIIHGKGTGVLRMEVLALLKNYTQVDRIESIKDDGGQRVYFKY